MAISIASNLKVTSTVPLDDKYGPYTASDEASAITLADAATAGGRYKGLTVGLIIGTDPIKEYWYADGITLTEKTSGGTVSSISAGTGMNFDTITSSGSVNIDSAKVPYYASGFSGSGLAKWNGTAWEIDNNTYLTTSVAASIYLTQTAAGNTYVPYTGATNNVLFSGRYVDLASSTTPTNSVKIGIDPTYSATIPIIQYSGVVTDGNPSVTIGDQEWMSQNLSVTAYTDGTPIPQVTDPTQWANLTTGAWCWYNNNSANGTTYGRLYNWYAVMGIYDAASLANPALRKKLAPDGWYIPTQAEWDTLAETLEGTSVAGGKMKQPGTSLWSPTNVTLTPYSGFAALPGGIRFGITNNGAFVNINTSTAFWSTTESGGFIITPSLSGSNTTLTTTISAKEGGAYVRCIKGNNKTTLISSNISNNTLTLPSSTGTLLTTIATAGGNLTTGTDGKVTIPDASVSTRGLVNTITQTFKGDKTFSDAITFNSTAYFASNVGIGTSSPLTSAKLEISSITQGFLPPRMTETQRNNIQQSVAGLIVYNTDNNTINLKDNASWKTVISGTGTNDYIPKYSASGLTIENSILYQTTTTFSGPPSFTNTYVRVGVSTGTMPFPYETLILEKDGDLKFGVYTSATNPIIAGNGAAAIVVGASKFQSSGFYPGFEYQFVGSGTEKDNRIRFNFIKRDGNGYVNSSKQDILNIFADGRVLIGGAALNPSTTNPTADSSALLEVRQSLSLGSTIGGFLPPRVTAAQRNNINNPAQGLMVYQTDGGSGVEGIYVCDFTGTWRRLNWT